MFNCLKKFFRPRKASGEFVGRRRTRDISFLAQSPVGFIGRITRSVPAPKVFPYANDATFPVASFGLAVMATTTNTVRSVLATDGPASTIFGIGVAPFPFQQQSGTNYGATPLTPLTAAPSGLLDILKSGPMTVYCNSAQAPSATLGSAVYVWVPASTGTHVQGGFETAYSGTIAGVAGANTGNGTIGTLSVAAPGLGGAYVVKFTSATAFQVTDPNGRQLLPGVTGAAYSDAGLTFTITAGGTAFVVGDSFTVTVTAQTVALSLSNSYFNGPGDSTGAIELAFNL
jgi:hypothetical protein